MKDNFYITRPNARVLYEGLVHKTRSCETHWRKGVKSHWFRTRCIETLIVTEQAQITSGPVNCLGCLA